MDDLQPSPPHTDPFFSESNLAHLRRGIVALDAGQGVEHDIIETDTEETDFSYKKAF